MAPRIILHSLKPCGAVIYWGKVDCPVINESPVPGVSDVDEKIINNEYAPKHAENMIV